MQRPPYNKYVFAVSLNNTDAGARRACSSAVESKAIWYFVRVERSELAVCRGKQLVADHVQMPTIVGRGQANGPANRSATLAGPARVFATQNRSDATLPHAFGYFWHKSSNN